MRQLIVIETTDSELIRAVTAVLPPEETRPDNAAYFSAEVESEAPLGYFCKQICEGLEDSSGAC